MVVCGLYEGILTSSLRTCQKIKLFSVLDLAIFKYRFGYV